MLSSERSRSAQILYVSQNILLLKSASIMPRTSPPKVCYFILSFPEFCNRNIIHSGPYLQPCLPAQVSEGFFPRIRCCGIRVCAEFDFPHTWLHRPPCPNKKCIWSRFSLSGQRRGHIDRCERSIVRRGAWHFPYESVSWRPTFYLTVDGRADRNPYRYVSPKIEQ